MIFSSKGSREFRCWECHNAVQHPHLKWDGCHVFFFTIWLSYCSQVSLSKFWQCLAWKPPLSQPPSQEYFTPLLDFTGFWQILIWSNLQRSILSLLRKICFIYHIWNHNFSPQEQIKEIFCFPGPEENDETTEAYGNVWLG